MMKRAEGEMMVATLLGLWLALLLAGETPVGQMLRRGLIEAPARWLMRWSRGDLLLTLLVVTGAALLIWLMEDEGRLLIGMFGPELVSTLMMFEVSAWLDALVTLVAMGSALRLRGVRQWVTMRLPRRRARAVRTRRAKRPAAANDGEDGPVALAA
ncbi:hypothetical protein ACX40Y_09370 [Sphingomonas sp. RS6]